MTPSSALRSPPQRSFAVFGHKFNAIYRFTARAVNGAGAGPETSPRVLFYQCAKYFESTGTGCRVGCSWVLLPDKLGMR